MADLAALIARLRELEARMAKPGLWQHRDIHEAMLALPELLRAAETWQRVLEVSVDSSVRTLSALGARVGMLIEDARALPLTGAPAWWMDRDQALAAPAPPPERTAEQERARVVDAARRLSRRSSDAGAATLLCAFALVIERGDHWPETGEEWDRG